MKRWQKWICAAAATLVGSAAMAVPVSVEFRGTFTPPPDEIIFGSPDPQTFSGGFTFDTDTALFMAAGSSRSGGVLAQDLHQISEFTNFFVTLSSGGSLEGTFGPRSVGTGDYLIGLWGPLAVPIGVQFVLSVPDRGALAVGDVSCETDLCGYHPVLDLSLLGQGVSALTSVSATVLQPPTNVPEPMTLSALGFGLIGLALARRRRH